MDEIIEIKRFKDKRSFRIGDEVFINKEYIGSIKYFSTRLELFNLIVLVYIIQKGIPIFITNLENLD